MIRVILAGDHTILREGLRELLKHERGIKIVAEVIDGKQLLNTLKDTPADVVLIDITMPTMNSVDATRYIAGNYKSTNVLVLPMLDHPARIKQMMEAGAKGYFLRNVGKEEFILAIKNLAAGKPFVTPKLASKLKDQDVHIVKLSKRELQVLQLLAEGLTNKEIAEKIFLSKRTVETHRKNLLDKTDSKNGPALIKYAILMGILNE